MDKKPTKIIVHLDSSNQHPPFIRGEGGDLSWEEGKQLTPLSEGEWVWESEALADEGVFKVLLDDQVYELGENHPLTPGSSVRINPKFPTLEP